MKNRRIRPFANLESGQALKAGVVIYLSISVVSLVAAATIYLNLTMISDQNSNSLFISVLEFLPPALWILHLPGLGIIFLLARKCHHCRLGAGKRISSALDKLGRGDLGWRITLRRGDELADLADYVTRASQSLADRIGKIQAQTRELAEVEDYLLETLEGDSAFKPYTIKALRKLKITINRLKSDVEDFQVSSLPLPKSEAGADEKSRISVLS
jgi:methyl-accepting chemotaxis protein